MEAVIEISVQEGTKLEAMVNGRSIQTDLPEKDGGQDSAPTPVDLFLAALGTCSTTYAKKFCDSRKISSQGLAVRMRCDISMEKFRINRITFEVTLPEDFPEKYRSALLRAMDQCTVKKHVMDPPEFASVIKE